MGGRPFAQGTSRRHHKTVKPLACGATSYDRLRRPSALNTDDPDENNLPRNFLMMKQFNWQSRFFCVVARCSITAAARLHKFCAKMSCYLLRSTQAVSFSRLLHVAIYRATRKRENDQFGGVFILDRDLLAQTYKLEPFRDSIWDDYPERRARKSSEAEEQVWGQT